MALMGLALESVSSSLSPTYMEDGTAASSPSLPISANMYV